MRNQGHSGIIRINQEYSGSIWNRNVENNICDPDFTVIMHLSHRDLVPLYMFIQIYFIFINVL